MIHTFKAVGAVQLALVASQHGIVLLVGAGLIRHGAAGLAGALAGTLALAAAAVGQGLTQAGLGDGLDMLHDGYPSNVKFHYAPFIIQHATAHFKIFAGEKGEIHSVRPPCLGFSVYHIVAFEH